MKVSKFTMTNAATILNWIDCMSCRKKTRNAKDNSRTAVLRYRNVFDRSCKSELAKKFIVITLILLSKESGTLFRHFRPAFYFLELYQKTD